MPATGIDLINDVAAWSRFRWCLRIVVLIQCIGLAGRYLFSVHEIESDIYGLLFFDWEWPETFAQSVDNLGSLITLLAGGVLFVVGLLTCDHEPQRRWRRQAYRLEQAAALWIALWMLLIAIAHMLRASGYPELALAEHAVRYAAPLAIILACVPFSRTGQTELQKSPRIRFAAWLLAIAAMATFVAHGYKAIDGYGGFVDLILLTDLRWTGWGWSQATAEQMLLAIGWIDIAIGIILVALWSRAAAIYMTVWGLVTAASRMTAMGLDLWPETLIRIANGGVPLAVLIYLLHLRQFHKPRTQSHDSQVAD